MGSFPSQRPMWYPGGGGQVTKFFQKSHDTWQMQRVVWKFCKMSEHHILPQWMVCAFQHGVHNHQNEHERCSGCTSACQSFALEREWFYAWTCRWASRRRVFCSQSWRLLFLFILVRYFDVVGSVTLRFPKRTPPPPIHRDIIRYLSSLWTLFIFDYISNQYQNWCVFKVILFRYVILKK